MALINIGLHKNTGGMISARTALAALILSGASVTAYQVRNSQSEPTLVAEIDGLDPVALDSLSRTLAQDCVAYVDNAGRGNLYGPLADLWGPFNRDFFLTIRETNQSALDARA